VFDVNTGSSSLVYAGGGRYLENIAAIPEPGTWALWLAGLAGLGVMRARRRRG
jgi:MYXO-CTERM domain-containing protein